MPNMGLAIRAPKYVSDHECTQHQMNINLTYLVPEQFYNQPTATNMYLTEPQYHRKYEIKLTCN
jgi:hypothetical protein